MDIIELYDEFGNLQKFKLLDTFGMDDDDYAVLISDVDDDDTIYIFRIMNTVEGELILEGITDEEELNDAVEIYEQLIKESLQ